MVYIMSIAWDFVRQLESEGLEDCVIMEDGRTEAIAREFSRVLKVWIGAENMDLLRQANDEEADEGICHSHDFCDANMAMQQAFQNLKLDEDNVAMWNAAWDMAKEKRFYA